MSDLEKILKEIQERTNLPYLIDNLKFSLQGFMENSLAIIKEKQRSIAELSSIKRNLEHKNFKLKKERDLYREALEFYADRLNWSVSEDHCGYLVEGVIDSSDTDKPEGSFLEHGGKRARQALKEGDKIRGSE